MWVRLLSGPELAAAAVVAGVDGGRVAGAATEPAGAVLARADAAIAVGAAADVGAAALVGPVDGAAVVGGLVVGLAPPQDARAETPASVDANARKSRRRMPI